VGNLGSKNNKMETTIPTSRKRLSLLHMLNNKTVHSYLEPMRIGALNHRNLRSLLTQSTENSHYAQDFTRSHRANKYIPQLQTFRSSLTSGNITLCVLQGSRVSAFPHPQLLVQLPRLFDHDSSSLNHHDPQYTKVHKDHPLQLLL
jgi:hypothetical protein